MDIQRTFKKFSKREGKILQSSKTSGRHWVQDNIIFTWNHGLVSPRKSGRSVKSSVWLARISRATYLERWNHPAISQVRKLSSPCSESATVDRPGYFLYGEPASAIPHCASPLAFSPIPVKHQCYYKQLRTGHMDSPFCDILAAVRLISTKVLAFYLHWNCHSDVDIFCHLYSMF